jgi:hypothetical protein
MADPQLLYIVSSVVLLALVAWVIAVLARAPAWPYARKNAETLATSPASPAASPRDVSVPVAPPAEDTSERKSQLDAHLEIHDEKAGDGKPGGG